MIHDNDEKLMSYRMLPITNQATQELLSISSILWDFRGDVCPISFTKAKLLIEDVVPGTRFMMLYAQQDAKKFAASVSNLDMTILDVQPLPDLTAYYMLCCKD